MALEHQWHRAPDGRYEGLRFPAIPIALEMAAVPKNERRRVMQGLRYMEGAALPVLNGIESEE